MMKSDENIKLDKMKNITSKIQNPNILELGVKKGKSTRMFLDICEKNNGYLTSIDIDDCSKILKHPKWNFIHSSDDNFDYINKLIKKDYDILLIDSLHEPNHIKKIFYNYFKFLKLNGIIFIDDVIWLPYVKGEARDNDFSERINRLTFDQIVRIYNSNKENLSLEIDFTGSGLAIFKKKNNQLNEDKKVINRMFTLKNLIKNIYAPKPKR